LAPNRIGPDGQQLNQLDIEAPAAGRAHTGTARSQGVQQRDVICPSAHAQNAVVVWGCWHSLSRKLGLDLAVVIMLLTSISHDPRSIFHMMYCSGMVGILVLWAFIALEKPVYAGSRNRLGRKLLSFSSIVIVMAGLLAPGAG
jgi:hypothetical protein